MDKTGEMRGPFPLKIAGIGRYLPKQVVSSSELESKYGLEEGWITANPGVRERRWVEDETPSFMGAEAAREAAANANMDPDDIDLILCASSTAIFERGLPDGGPLIQQQLGLEDSGIACFTMQNNCLSFMMALDVCAGLLISGRYQNILVVSSEIFSRNLDFNNPYVYGLFGDGAAAAVVTLPPEGETSGIHQVKFETYSHGVTYMQSLMGFTAMKNKNVQPEDLTLQMDSAVFYKYGHQYTLELLEKLLKNKTTSLEDIKIIIPQQLGNDFLEPLKRSIGIPGEKIIRVIDNLGFCGAASIPMALYEAIDREKLNRGDRFLMLGVGAGLSVGGMIVTY